MTTILKRYDPYVPNNNGCGSSLDDSVMKVRPDGEYIRVDDILELLDERRNAAEFTTLGMIQEWIRGNQP